MYWNLRVYYSRESDRDGEREGCLQTQTAAFKESLQRCIMGGHGRLLLMKAFIDGQSGHSTGSSQLKVNTARMLLILDPHWVVHSPSLPRAVSICLTIESHGAWLAAGSSLSQEARSLVQSHLSSCKLLIHSAQNGF